jgi:4-hydroxy-tetrahydrodipicolinate reductase
MIKAIVAGAAGRMGGRIIHMIRQSQDITLTAAFEHPDHPNVNEDVGRAAGIGKIGVNIAKSLQEVIGLGEVLIDFTTPEATLENLKLAASHDLSMVIGTTGFSREHLKEATELAKKIRCVMARIVGEMAEILGKDYDMEILEVHHRRKKDAPSGTALRLAQIMATAVNRDLEKVAVYERRGLVGERSDEEIGIQSWRAGDVTGDHTVMFGGIGERLELTHRAHNRDNFARGALRAVTWIVKQPAGLYDMQDVLGLR